MKNLNQKRLFATSLLAVLFHAMIALLLQVFARAGGAGGGGGGGGGSGGGGFSGGSFGAGDIELIIILGFVIFYSHMNTRRQQRAFIKKINSSQTLKPADLKRIQENDPEFSQAQFLHKVRTAFIDIQDAWTRKDLSQVRRYISDGVYRRFITQFQMMDLLDQTNYLSNLCIHDIWFESVDTDGVFDVIDVGIQASIYDRFESRIIPEQNSGGHERFIEYWSFIRRRD